MNTNDRHLRRVSSRMRSAHEQRRLIIFSYGLDKKR
jgi:hypothetical protein